jgi:CubicO group peptidase (beta-lactamase class C family)
MKKLVLATALAFIFTSVSFSQAGPIGDELAERTNKLFAQWDKPDSPGCALAVIKDGRIIYKRGYGAANLDHGVPISPATVFYIASTSKQFTAASILLLARQGKISLDDDIRKHLPEMAQYDARVTIRHLIHHTSGIRDYLELMSIADAPTENIYTEQEMIDLIARQKRLNFKPGDQHLYSNSGYFLLSQIVKRASGKSLREFAEENIFKPLGMRNTHFHDDRAMVVKNRATGYVPRGGGFSVVLTNFDKVGDGGLLTTVEDLALWDQNFYENKIGGGPDFLSQLQTPATLNGGEKLTYAAGLAVSEYRGLKVVGHGGSFNGFRAEMIRFLEQKFSVICLCNLGNINPTSLAFQTADIYLADHLKKEVVAGPTAPTQNAVKLSEQELAEKTGQYYNHQNKSVRRLYVAGGKLFYLRSLGDISELMPISKDRFIMLGTPKRVEVTFKSAAGRPLEMQVAPEGQKPAILTAFQAVSLSGAELAGYAGDYYSEELQSTYKLVVKDEGLYIKRKGGSEIRMTPIIKDEFRVPGLIITFAHDSERRITGFTLDGDRSRQIVFERAASQPARAAGGIK